jgi:hypothetical protein
MGIIRANNYYAIFVILLETEIEFADTIFVTAYRLKIAFYR